MFQRATCRCVVPTKACCAQEAAAQTQSPKDAAALPGGDRLAVSQRMAVKAVVNMTFGEPEECQRVACQSLVKALKSGTPAKRLACAQVLQHTLAHQSGRVLLHGMQIIPALVALCSTGMLGCRGLQFCQWLSPRQLLRLLVWLLTLCASAVWVDMHVQWWLWL